MRVKKIAGSLLVIGMAVQILWGVLWLVCNATPEWTYPESEYYIEAAGTWILDEYTGVLYPAIINVCQMVTGWFGLPFQGLLYLLQLVAAFLCASGFVALCRYDRSTTEGRPVGREKERKRLWNAFGGLYLMTVPLCVQWHLSVLPQSFVSSLFLLAFGLCVRAAENRLYRNWKFFLMINGLWVLLSLLQPDNWWLGLVFVIFAAILLLKESKVLKETAIGLATIILAGVLAAGVNFALQTPGSSGKIQRSLGASMVSRMVWPNFDTNYFFWPDEIKEIMTLEEGREISSYADMVQTVFGPLVEDAYGKEKANEMYWQMAINCMGMRTKEIIQAVGSDFTAYLFTPWKVKSQLDGSGLSYSGWNYEKMRTEVPKLTGCYVDYGLVSFRAGILTVIFLILWQIVKKRGEKKKIVGYKPVLGLAVCVILSQALWHTMAGGGMMDYRNVPVVILLWYSVILCCAGLCLEENWI